MRRDHPGAAVLHGDGGAVALGGAGVHHADAPARRSGKNQFVNFIIIVFQIISRNQTSHTVS